MKFLRPQTTVHIALDITEASVVKGTTGIMIDGTAGATITQGMPVYKDLTDNNKWKPCALTSAAAALCGGIALCSASSGQPLKILKSGRITIGATMVLGEPYFVGAAGAIIPAADLANGNYVTYLGLAVTTAILDVQIHVSGVASARP